MDQADTSQSSEEAPGSSPSCFMVPLASLSEQGDGAAATPPAEGDSVSVQIEGTVSKIEGDQAEVTISTVNGQPVDSGQPEEPNESDLRGMAAKSDQESSY